MCTYENVLQAKKCAMCSHMFPALNSKSDTFHSENIKPNQSVKIPAIFNSAMLKINKKSNNLDREDIEESSERSRRSKLKDISTSASSSNVTNQKLKTNHGRHVEPIIELSESEDSNISDTESDDDAEDEEDVISESDNDSGESSISDIDDDSIYEEEDEEEVERDTQHVANKGGINKMIDLINGGISNKDLHKYMKHNNNSTTNNTPTDDRRMIVTDLTCDSDEEWNHKHTNNFISTQSNRVNNTNNIVEGVCHITLCCTVLYYRSITLFHFNASYRHR
jgi:hypothetical protein